MFFMSLIPERSIIINAVIDRMVRAAFPELISDFFHSFKGETGSELFVSLVRHRELSTSAGNSQVRQNIAKRMNAAAVTMATLSQKELFSGGSAWNFRFFIVLAPYFQ